MGKVDDGEEVVVQGKVAANGGERFEVDGGQTVVGEADTCNPQVGDTAKVNGTERRVGQVGEARKTCDDRKTTRA